MTVTREIIAENITRLRKSAKLTQAELAEKLNYSDKAISKWERGDSIPDVFVLSELASLFSVTVDYFLCEHSDNEKKPVLEEYKKRTRLAVVLTACVSPYAVSALLFLIFSELYSKPDWLWKLFVLPLPLVAVLSLVFSAVWLKKRVSVIISVSLLLWTAILAVFVCVYEMFEAWFLFVIGAPLQVIILFWLLVARKKNQ